LSDAPLVTNVRHIVLLERARTALGRAIDAAASNEAPVSEEFLLADIQEAIAHLQEITGRRTTDDLLRHIFQNFCIGK
jgi:tRNA modification GTPase